MMRKSLNYFLAGLLFIGISMSSCSDSSKPSKTSTRYIYYTASTGDSASGSDLGFFCFTTHDRQFKQVASTSILNTTGVAKNAIVLFEKEADEPIRLLARCENRHLREVPFPVLPSGGELKYYLPPHVALDYDGHHAAWLMYEEISGGNPANVPYLILYNCNSDDTTIVNILTFINSKDSTISRAEPAGEYVIISNEGSVVWFVLKLYDESGGVKGWRIVKNDAGVMDWASELSGEEITLSGLEFVSDNIIAKKGDAIYSVSSTGSFDPTYLKPGNMSNPYQFARTRKELAVWTDDGIAIHKYGEGDVFNKIVDFVEIGNIYNNYVAAPTEKLAISPDGEVIVFGLKRTDSGKFDLVMANRDGNGLTLIKEDFYFGMAVVSKEMEVE